MKMFGKILLAGVVIVVVLLGLSGLYHGYQLRKEAKAYPPSGELVSTNDNRMHVYTEGQGEITLVFMSGSGTSSPTIDFKPLWRRMTGDYRIAVVEKPGYGWSEGSSSSRDIDTTLAETREALNLAGEKGPFVLVPHSMSGLEAIYWAQKYPDEVETIIGLDPAIPDVYLDSSFELPRRSKLYLTYLMSRIGLTRFMGRAGLEENLPLLKSEELSEKDKEKLKAIFYKSALTKPMLNEINHIQENARKVEANGIPFDTPMYFFIAEDNVDIIPTWKEELSQYVSKTDYGKFKLLESGHYVHQEKSDVIAVDMKDFLEEIEEFTKKRIE
ncbi:MAG: alpha/beta fold hydrolase [Candidatus Bipolaricaulota bacterium]